MPPHPVGTIIRGAMPPVKGGLHVAWYLASRAPPGWPGMAKAIGTGGMV